MCEILVKRVDHVHPDAVIDGRGAYKRGDPVVVMPDGHEWGREECPPKFVVIRLPGVDPEEMRARMEPRKEKRLMEVVDRRGRKERRLVDVPIERRRFRLSGTLMDAADAAGGTLTVKPDEFDRAAKVKG